jgi:hypothetical protein
MQESSTNLSNKSKLILDLKLTLNKKSITPMNQSKIITAIILALIITIIAIIAKTWERT